MEYKKLNKLDISFKELAQAKLVKKDKICMLQKLFTTSQ